MLNRVKLHVYDLSLNMAPYITGLKMFISENHTNADTSKFAGLKKKFYAQDR